MITVTVDESTKTICILGLRYLSELMKMIENRSSLKILYLYVCLWIFTTNYQQRQ